MRDRDAERLDREIDRISRELPSGAGRFLRWLRGSSSRWVRVSVGLLLIIFGIFGFLPANTAGARFVGNENWSNGSVDPNHDRLAVARSRWLNNAVGRRRDCGSGWRVDG
jgi:hypothetical protein